MLVRADKWRDEGRQVLFDFWQFSKSLTELWIILLLFGTYSTLNKVQHQRRLTLVEHPLVSDLYLVDFLQINHKANVQFRYSLLKLTDVDQNHIQFVVSSYSYSKPIEVKDIVKFDVQLLVSNYFGCKVYTVSRETFSSWSDKSIIYDIARPDGLYISGSLVLTPKEALEANKKNARLLAGNP